MLLGSAIELMTPANVLFLIQLLKRRTTDGDAFVFVRVDLFSRCYLDMLLRLAGWNMVVLAHVFLSDWNSHLVDLEVRG